MRKVVVLRNGGESSCENDLVLRVMSGSDCEI